MPRPFTQDERKWIQERLVEAGEKSFSTAGLKKTTVAELASAAGISKAAFYLFYESKEALFMDVVELAEQRFRRVVLAEVDRPGPTPRARLVAVLEKAFTLWKTIPVLQFFTSDDFNTLARRMPVEKVQEHLTSDREFVEALIARCRAAGIPVRAGAGEIGSLLYTLFFTVLHEDDLGPGSLAPGIAILLELVAAYCLGELALSAETTALFAQNASERRPL